MEVYVAVVSASILYMWEFWTLYRRHIKKMENFYMRALRSILGNRWRDLVTRLEVMDCAYSTRIEPMLIKTNSDRWIMSSAFHAMRSAVRRVPSWQEKGAVKRHCEI